MNLVNPQSKVVAVSAPGKVLLAGGYLVLDRAHTGLSFGLDARIHVLVRGGGEAACQVRSPQFHDAVWRYDWSKTQCIAELGEARNPFVKSAVEYAFQWIRGHSTPKGFVLCSG